MARPATEVCYITLKAGLDLESTTPEAQVWQETLSTIEAQEGYQRAYYGRQLEDTNVLMLFIDWANVDAHKQFIASPQYGPFKQKLGTIMEGVHLHHINSIPHPPTIIGRAPCTEVAAFFEAEQGFLEKVKEFGEVLEKGKPDGYLGYAYGSVIELVARHKDEGKEGVTKGAAVMALIGWQSREKHLKFRDSQLFKDNIWMLREKNGGAEVVSYHVALDCRWLVTDEEIVPRPLQSCMSISIMGETKR